MPDQSSPPNSPRKARPPPFATAYAALLKTAEDLTRPADERIRAAITAGDLAAARAPDSAIAAYRAAAAIDPLDGSPAIAAAAILARRGDFGEARAAAAQAFRTSLDETVRADSAFLLGEIALANEHIGEAADAFEASSQLFQRVHARNKTDPAPLTALARLHLRRADIALIQGETVGAEDHAQRAAAILDGLQVQFPHDERLMADARACLDRQVDLAMAKEDPSTAALWLDRLLPLAHAAHQAARDDRSAQRNLGLIRLKHSLVSERLGRVQDALESADAAIGYLAALAAQERQSPVAAHDLARALRRRAELALRQQDAALAAAAAAQAGTLLETFMARAPPDSVMARDRASAAILEGDAALHMRQADAARTAFITARDICAAAAGHNPAATDWCAALATAWDRLGDAHWSRGHAAEARAAFAESLALRAKLPDQSAPAVTRTRAQTAEKLALAAAAQRDLHPAFAAAKIAAMARQDLADAAPENFALRETYAQAMMALAAAAHAIGAHDEAINAGEDALVLAQSCPSWVDQATHAKRKRAHLLANRAQLADRHTTQHAAQAVAILEALIAAHDASAQDMALRAALLRI